jgi:hypothetical protein
MLRDPQAPGKDRAYTVVKRGEALGAAVRFERFRYTEWVTPDKNELYDLDADPRERTNLALRPDHAATVTRARQVLARAREEAQAQRMQVR